MEENTHNEKRMTQLYASLSVNVANTRQIRIAPLKQNKFFQSFDISNDTIEIVLHRHEFEITLNWYEKHVSLVLAKSRLKGLVDV